VELGRASRRARHGRRPLLDPASRAGPTLREADQRGSLGVRPLPRGNRGAGGGEAPRHVSARIAYLGPAGTFTEDALRAAMARADEFEPQPAATIHDAILAVEAGDADRALVPFENSIEGSVRPTLDTLAFEVEAVAIVGEFDHPVRVSLIAGRELALEEVSVVLSHPQASAQCARFLREQLPRAAVQTTSSTA